MATTATLAFLSLAIGGATLKPEDRWSRNNPTAKISVDHSAWQIFLSKYLDTVAADGIHRVRYGAVFKADRAGLEGYLQALQSMAVSKLNRNEQKAYWINLYNAATVALVLQHFPVKSIRDIRPSKTSPKTGPWDHAWLKVEGVDLSLNNLEHQILRPLWKDPRVHFALNCASLGCPNLAPKAYIPANLEALLDQGARTFISSPNGVQLENGILRLSSIFDWYASDFGKNRSEVLAYLASFATPALSGTLKAYSGKIEYRYDWMLNQAP